MKTLPRILIALLLFSAAAFAELGMPSQYDRKTARKLSSDEVGAFGPQATKYRYDSRMIRAAEIAADRARGHSTNYCWRYVKRALDRKAHV